MSEMDAGAVIRLIESVCTYVAAVLGYVAISRRSRPPFAPLTQAMLGLVFGATVVVGMMAPIEPLPGVRIDGRSVMIVLSAPFGGPIAGVLTAVAAAAFRVYTGGIGVSAGLIGIATAAGIGFGFARWARENPTSSQLVLLAIVTAAVAPLPVLVLPGGIGGAVFLSSAPVLLVANFAGVMLIGTFLRLELQRRRLDDTVSSANAHLVEMVDKYQESERKYRAIHDNLADGIITIDAKGVILSVNPACERLFGYTEKHLVGRNVSCLMTRDVGAEHDGYLSSYLDGSRPPSIIGRGREVEGLRADGGRFPLYLAISRSELRGEVLFTGVAQDISVRKGAEKALTESEARFRDLIEGSLQGVCVHQDFAPRFVNDAFARMLGWERAEAMDGPSSIMDFVVPGLRDRFRGDIERLVSGSPASSPLRIGFVRRDGTNLWVDVISRVVAWDGGTAVQSTFMDVTEQVESERELKEQAERMTALLRQYDAARREAEKSRHEAEVASAAKSRFLAIMSHELRTPMTGIMGIVDVMLEDPKDEEQKKLLLSLRDVSESLTAMLNNVLDFSKIEADELTLETIDFSPASLIAGVAQLFTHKASAKGLTLTTSISPNVPETACGDPTRLRQIMTNLIGNGVKFTDRGGIEVIADARPDPTGGWVLSAAVTDTGIGIVPEQLETLFKPFQQADISTTRRFGGSGLGLAICRRLVEAMGGAIHLESAAGGGVSARFSVRLRSAIVVGDEVAAPDGDVRTDAVAGDGAVLKVLVAEDNDVSRMVIETILTRRHGYDVVGVVNGEEAVAAVEAEPFDVVLMDMQMPVLDGVGAMGRIRALPSPRRDIPIVAITADAMVGHRSGYLEAGALEVVTKPIDWRELHAAILRHVGDGRNGEGAAPPATPTREGEADGDGILCGEKLRELVEAIGAEGADMLIDEFRRDVANRLAEIDRALGAGDLDIVVRGAHAMAGFVGSFGAIRLEVACRAMEQREREPAPPDLAEARRLFPELETIARLTLRTLGDRFPAGRPDPHSTS